VAGAAARNQLIGGDGADALPGSVIDDILINGNSAHDDKDAILDAIMAQWAASNSFATRKPLGGLETHWPNL
jgi:hypothetical protein